MHSLDNSANTTQISKTFYQTYHDCYPQNGKFTKLEGYTYIDHHEKNGTITVSKVLPTNETIAMIKKQLDEDTANAVIKQLKSKQLFLKL